ncbi:MAG: hypothetical protein CFK52_01965 [Chloracidobacterium sp. CP2_5A]|nr:MAG: hypothetical protein CFK52_01965 [Chloracidobacterium sp. CP2_5A]
MRVAFCFLLAGLRSRPWDAPLPPGWERLPPASCRQLEPFFPELNLRRDVLWRVDGLPWWARRFAVIPPAAITLGSLVWVAPDWLAPETPDGVELIAHELVHVTQYRRYGCLGFARRYGLAFLRNALRGDSLAAAYENIPLEVEARLRAADIRKRLVFV